MTCPVIKYEFFQTKEKEYDSAENRIQSQLLLSKIRVVGK